MLEFNIEQRGECTFLTFVTQEEQLDPTVHRMLMHNTISGLLAYSSAQINNKRICSYNITSKVPLRQYFSRPVKRAVLLRTMLGILNAVESSKDYLIRPSELLFDCDYIYVSVSDGAPSLLCLPVPQEQGQNLQTFFRELLFSTSFDQSEDRSYVAELMAFLNQPVATRYREFRTRLEEMLETKQHAAPAPQFHPAGQPPHQAAPMQHACSPAPAQSQPVPPPTMPGQGQPISAPVPDRNEPQPAKPEKKRLRIFWGKKEKYPAPPAQNQGYTSVRYRVPGMDQNLSVSPAPKPQKMAASTAPLSDRPQPAPYMPPQPTAYTPPQPAPHMPPPPPQSALPSYDRQPQTCQSHGPNYPRVPTVNLASEETTVMGASKYGNKPWLIQLRTGTACPVDHLPYRIGKESTYVDFCVRDNTAVSRSHADIQQDDEGYWITDNNSKNHTIIDGHRLTPGQRHALVSGMHFYLANEEFLFELR